MAMAGYSGTPLLKKLGIAPGMKIQLLNPPVNYYELLAMDIGHQLCTKDEIPDLVHMFATNNQIFESCMESVSSFRKKNPRIMVWVSWYKKSAKIPTDITEDTIRIFALKHDWVDIKVCAVNEVWSALKLVVPINKRKQGSC